MPVKKTKRVQSQTKTNKTPPKKTSAKKTSSNIKSRSKNLLKKESLANRIGAKKIVSIKNEQLVKQEPIIDKETKSKKMLWSIIILLVVLTLWFLRDQFIVAMVNGKPITRFQVISELEKQGASRVLESLVTMELISQTIKNSGIEASEEEKADQIADIEERLTAQGQNLDDILAMQNSTRAEIEENIRLNIQVDKLLADQIQVSEEEVLEYFENNKEFLGEGVNFDEMREEIEAQVIQEKRSEAQQAWLETIQNEANIRYLRFEPSSIY